jgi:RHS repeat-associated protein
MTKMRVWLFHLPIIMVLICCSPCRGQVATGTPPFGSFISGPDIINLANLNSHISVPIINKAGRGMPLAYDMSYDTSIWYPLTSGGTKLWRPVINFGWRGQTEAALGYISFSGTLTTCDVNNERGEQFVYTNWVYHDPFGTPHAFNGETETFNGSCGSGSSTLNATASDDSGYTISLLGSSLTSLVTSNGKIIQAPVSSTAGSGAMTDPNGNQITVSSSEVFTDTLGQTALTVAGSGTPTSPITMTYTGPSGSAASYTMKYTSYNVQTSFGCSGVTEYSATGISLVSEIDLPNGTKYTFTYEPTPGSSGDVTGRVQEVTLPNGVTITYTFGSAHDGINCSDGTGLNLTRAIYDGTNTTTWQFSRASSVTTVTAPQMPYDSAANQSVYTFNSSGQETQEKLYQGSTSGTLLRTINTTWASNGTPATKITILEDNSTQSEVETTYDTFGNLDVLKEHDFGTGAPGAVLRTTNYTYLSTTAYTNLNIMDRVTEKSIVDSTGTVQYVEDTAYDGSALNPCPTGIPQHNDTNYGCSFLTRGNPTSVTTYATASTKAGAVAKNKHYDMFGNVVLADADCCQSMSWDFSATTEYSSPDSVVSGSSSGTHTTANYTYNSYTGQIASITDPNSQKTSYAYDSMCRLTTMTRPDSAQIIQSYNDTSHTTSNSQPIQGTSIIKRTEYLDGLGRTSQTSIFDASSNVYSTTQREYDGLDRPYNVSNPFTSSAQYWTETIYDALGRKLKVIFPDSSQTTFAYSTSSITQTDPAGHQRKMQTDGLNRLSVVFEPDPTNGNSLTLQSSYAYTVLDNLASLTQGSQTRTYSYDGMGRLTSHTLPESGTTSFQYNTYSQISRRTDARGVITTYTYDTMNRPYQISYNVGTTGVPATPTVTYAFGTNASQFNNGRVLTITDGLGTVTNTYDNLARPTQVQHVINGTTYTIGYGYNLAGAVTSLTYPSGRVVQPSYDAIGRLSSLLSGTTTYASSFTYNSAFEPTNFTMGNGVAVTAGYSANRLQLQSLNYAGGSTVFSTTYGYTQNAGNNGQITSITDGFDSGRSIAYTYDALNRLSTAVTTGSTNYPKWGLSFTYDRYGNRTAQTVTAGTAPSNSVVVSATTNHITTSGYAYDLNGNMTNDAVNTITYDGENRLVSSSGSGGSGTYSYRASGLRAVKVSGGTTTVYLFDGNNDIAEYTNGILANEHVYSGNQRLASYLSGTLYYQAGDHLSSRVILDSSGNIAGQKGHFSFGEDWYMTALTNRHFTSYERDAESSNDNAQHRFYVNRLGRFSATDPMPGGGQNPQRFNRYNYVYNDPVNRHDPTGMSTTRDCWFLGCPPGVGGDDDDDDDDGGGLGGGGGNNCNPDQVEGNSCPPSEPTPPPPPPTPSCMAELYDRPVKHTHGLANHAFWIVRGEDGSDWTLEGGPDDDGIVKPLLHLSKVQAWWTADSPPVPPHFDADTPNAHRDQIFGTGSEADANVCAAVFIMKSFTETFPNGRIPYDPIFGPNSNSVAHALGIYGELPSVDQPPRTPGWNFILTW